jgi:hypothetical protein
VYAYFECNKRRTIIVIADSTVINPHFGVKDCIWGALVSLAFSSLIVRESFVVELS